MYVPDNIDEYENYESEQERIHKLHRRLQLEIEMEEKKDE
ncbi:MAG: hypothetical protein K0S76_476 [Herbinix sp.]|jgi:hypothetical protein|nr:hypothetical protein [Herbinix sp.]